MALPASITLGPLGTERSEAITWLNVEVRHHGRRVGRVQ